jgi:hypothetical protein
MPIFMPPDGNYQDPRLLGSLFRDTIAKVQRFKDNSALRSKSTKLFTLAALYDANRELLKGKENDDVIDNANLYQRPRLLTHFWDSQIGETLTRCLFTTLEQHRWVGRLGSHGSI